MQSCSFFCPCDMSGKPGKKDVIYSQEPTELEELARLSFRG